MEPRFPPPARELGAIANRSDTETSNAAAPMFARLCDEPPAFRPKYWMNSSPQGLRPIGFHRNAWHGNTPAYRLCLITDLAILQAERRCIFVVIGFRRCGWPALIHSNLTMYCDEQLWLAIF